LNRAVVEQFEARSGLVFTIIISKLFTIRR
jgi:hypothetical protein